jgi:hypothetical protein
MVFTSAPKPDDRDLLPVVQLIRLDGHRHVVTGTSNSKSAVTSTPSAGAVLKVTGPVVVSTDQPEGWSVSSRYTFTVPATGLVMVRGLDHAPRRVALDQLELSQGIIARPKELPGGLVVGPVLEPKWPALVATTVVANSGPPVAP